MKDWLEEKRLGREVRCDGEFPEFFAGLAVERAAKCLAPPDGRGDAEDRKRIDRGFGKLRPKQTPRMKLAVAFAFSGGDLPGSGGAASNSRATD